MIKPVEDGFVISSHHLWLPGCYADIRAARYAFRFRRADLERLNKLVRPSVITYEMLRALRDQKKR